MFPKIFKFCLRFVLFIMLVLLLLTHGSYICPLEFFMFCIFVFEKKKKKNFFVMVNNRLNFFSDLWSNRKVTIVTSIFKCRDNKNDSIQ